MTTVMTLVTLFALIGDDIRLWAFWKVSDPYFFSGMILAMVLFGAEILMNTVVVDDFKYSFFCWLDIIATFSLVPDIEWVADYFMGLMFNTEPSS